MFQRLRLWIAGASGLKEAARDSAREATREGLIEGFNAGVGDFIEHVTGNRALESDHGRPVTIEASSNGHHAETNGADVDEEPEEPAPLTASELRGMRKSDLLKTAKKQGYDVDESWTVKELREELIG